MLQKKGKSILDELGIAYESEESHASHSGVSSDGENRAEYEKKDAFWDSALLTESKSVVNEFFKKKEKKCQNCKMANPKITKPTFGWFHVVCSISLNCLLIFHYILVALITCISKTLHTKLHRQEFLILN